MTTPQPAALPESATVLPDGSAFAIASFPLPADHWLYAPREYRDGEDDPIELPAPILNHRDHGDAVRAAIRYAVRSATMCGKEEDFDPDALVQNAMYALCGPFGAAAMQSQPAAPGVTGAVQTLIETLKADPEYAWAWHCNVAMAAVDEGLSHYAANKAAARFLSWLAQIDTTTHPGFPKAPEQPAAAGVSDRVVKALLAQALFFKEGAHTVASLEADIRAILALRPQAVPMTEGPKKSRVEIALETTLDRYNERHGITAQGAQGGEG